HSMRLVNGDALALLRRIGLNQYESRVYLALLGYGSTTASELSDLAGIPRPRTYDVLEKLHKKGFVSEQPGRPAKFRASSVSEAFSSLKEAKSRELKKQLVDIEKIKGELEGHAKTLEPTPGTGSEDMVWVLKDGENIKSKISSLIENAQKLIMISTTPSGLKNKLSTYEDTLRSAKKRGVKIHIVAAPQELQLEKQAKQLGTIVKKGDMPRLVIADDHVFLFLTPETEKQQVGTWIQSPYVAQSFRNLLL
ncbi:TrmB family transcriptional regulator, partial [archaeon]|nr:TrmB family transcriptional regulator [archaeon]